MAKFVAVRQFTMLLASLCWITLCVRAYRNEEAYRRAYEVVPNILKTLYFSELQSGNVDYYAKYVRAIVREATKMCHGNNFSTNQIKLHST